MRRYILFFAVLGLLLNLCACSAKQESIRQPVNFYYCSDPSAYDSGSSVIIPEVRDASGYETDTMGLLNQFIRGPQTSQLLSPFPAGTTIVALVQKDSTLQITLSPEFSRLTGMELTIACACLSMTVLELTDHEAVEITAEDNQLDNRESVIMTRDSLMLMDSGAAAED